MFGLTIPLFIYCMAAKSKGLLQLAIRKKKIQRAGNFSFIYVSMHLIICVSIIVGITLLH